MNNSELGTKYTCSSCGMKFYDLNRASVSCPGCGTVPEGATDASVPAEPEEEIIAEVEEAELADADATVEAQTDDEQAEEDDEDDDGVEEIDMNDEAAELRLLESAGSDDDDIAIDSDKLEEDEIEVSDLEGFGSDDEGTTDASDEDDTE